MYPNIETERCKNHFQDEKLDSTIAVGIYFQVKLMKEGYNNLLSDFIRMLKNYMEYAKPLASAMILILKNRIYPTLDIDEIDYVIPIPKHIQELKIDMETGEKYNQAEALAKIIAEHLEKPLLTNVLHKKIPGSMTNKSKEERLEFALKAYDVKDKHNEIRNSVILLVDDVRTSGATAHACAKVLKEKLHAREVHLIVAGRTVHKDWKGPANEEIY